MGEKTTIEINNIRELKQHALDTNKTLRQLINEAIAEKIERERVQFKKGTNLLVKKEPVSNPSFVQKQYNISQLKIMLSTAGLLAIVEKECNRHNLQFEDISPKSVTPELLADIHTAIKLVFDDETANKIIQKIKSMFK